MDDTQFRRYIIQPALRSLAIYNKSKQMVSLWSQAVENILIATKNKESLNDYYLVQINAPMTGGKGLYQVEPRTHTYIKERLVLKQNKSLTDTILDLCSLSEFPDDDALIYHLRYATIIARLKYWYIEEPLPAANDAEGCLNYYLRYYNTAAGKSTSENSIEYFKEACKDV